MLVIYHLKYFLPVQHNQTNFSYTVSDDIPHGLIASTNGTYTKPKKGTSTGSKRPMRHFETKGWKQHFIHFIVHYSYN